MHRMRNRVVARTGIQGRQGTSPMPTINAILWMVGSLIEWGKGQCKSRRIIVTLQRWTFYRRVYAFTPKGKGARAPARRHRPLILRTRSHGSGQSMHRRKGETARSFRCGRKKTATSEWRCVRFSRRRATSPAGIAEFCAHIHVAREQGSAITSIS